MTLVKCCKTRKQGNKETRKYDCTVLFFREHVMLAKLTSKNQITLPKAAVLSIDAADYFDVAIDNGRIILTPVRVRQAQAVRDKLARLGITEQDVMDAVAWARR
jgi:hypothetical protein